MCCPDSEPMASCCFIERAQADAVDDGPERVDIEAWVASPCKGNDKGT